MAYEQLELDLGFEEEDSIKGCSGFTLRELALIFSGMSEELIKKELRKDGSTNKTCET